MQQQLAQEDQWWDLLFFFFFKGETWIPLRCFMQLLTHETGCSVMLLWLNAALYGAIVKVRFLNNKTDSSSPPVKSGDVGRRRPQSPLWLLTMSAADNKRLHSGWKDRLICSWVERNPLHLPDKAFSETGSSTDTPRAKSGDDTHLSDAYFYYFSNEL